uniref:Amino acid transporter transmembrane domain-containing protein n=1 Tax=Arcella intermedia TaxID=1963864 RepID=A0A6B2L2W7_9EUKA
MLFNNLSGPGMVGLPKLFQQGGYIFPIISMIWIGITTWLSSSMICEAMRYCPGNKGYSGRIEFASLCKEYLGKVLFVIILVIFVISLQSVNVSGIIETAQVMDKIIIAIGGRTGAIEFYPNPGWIWSSNEESPWSSGTYVLSLGFVATVILIIPLGYFNLDDNMIVQKGAFVIAIAIFVEWIVFFIIRLKEPVHTIPAFGYKMAPVFGTIMFNYAVVVTIPSWCNEKTHNTRVNRTLIYSTVVGTVLFIITGILGGMTCNIRGNDDLLDALTEPGVPIILKASVYLFPLAVIATSIPIYSIIVRYNLLENKICGKALANFIGVILPWLIVIPFYTGDGLTIVMNWSTLISNGIVNFIVPFVLFILARKRKMTLTETEKEEMDASVPAECREEDLVLFGKVLVDGAPANSHFAFGVLFDDQSITPIVISATFVASLTFAFLGVLVINVLDALNIP